MGAGRKTQSHVYDSQGKYGNRPVPQQRSLPQEELGGVIFGCNKDTFNECVTNMLFGLPHAHINYVQWIHPGMPLFLFNYTDRKLHGVFEAASDGDLNINPHAWTRDGKSQTTFPAQVQVKWRQKCPPISEKDFSVVIKENYYSSTHFMFELTHAQTERLLSVFAQPVTGKAKVASAPVSKTARQDLAWANSNPGTGDDAWAAGSSSSAPPPLPSAWQTRPASAPAPPANPYPPLPAWKAGAPSGNGTSGAPQPTESQQPVGNGYPAQAPTQEAPAPPAQQIPPSPAQETPRKDAKNSIQAPPVQEVRKQYQEVIKPVTSPVQEVKVQHPTEPSPVQLKEVTNDKRGSRAVTMQHPEVVSSWSDGKRTPESPVTKSAREAAERQAKTEAKLKAVAQEEKEREERERQHSLEMAKKNRNGPGATSPSGSRPQLVNANGVSKYDWEAGLANKHAAEQALLREDRAKLVQELKSVDPNFGKAVQKNLEFCAAAIGQMRQESINLKKAAANFSAPNEDVKVLKVKNEELQRTQAIMGQELSALRSQVELMQRQLQALISAPNTLSVAPTALTISRASSPTVAARPRSSSIPKSLYLMGGLDTPDQWLASVDRYVPSLDSWEPRAPMLSVRSYAAAASLEGRIYVFGGGNGQNDWYSSVEVYDPVRDYWQPCAPMSTRKGSLGGATVQGKIYAVGGGSGLAYYADVEVYDPSDMWVPVAPMLHQRFSPSAAELGGALYALGGFNGQQYETSMERFDPREGRWYEVAPMGVRRGSCSAASYNGLLYAAGGFDGTAFYSTVEVYDPRADRWQMVQPLEATRAYGAAGEADGALYFIGGIDGQRNVNTLERYTPETGWTVRQIPVVKRSLFALAVLQG